jgi:hypothetical protein
VTDLEKTERLRTGERCEFRYPARPGWRSGKVERNGGSGYWEVWDDESGRLMHGLYIEHVRAPGTDPWAES